LSNLREQTVLAQVAQQGHVHRREVAGLVIHVINQVPVAGAGGRDGRRKRSDKGGAALHLDDVHVAEGKATGHLEQRTRDVSKSYCDARLEYSAKRCGPKGG